ncbi:hypothetical protein SprV_0702405300 [Sparganum proliferum]
MSETTRHTWAEAQRTDPDTTTIYHHLTNNLNKPLEAEMRGSSQHARILLHQWPHLLVDNDISFLRYPASKRLRPVVPGCLIESVLADIHAELCHCGQKRTELAAPASYIINASYTLPLLSNKLFAFPVRRLTSGAVARLLQPLVIGVVHRPEVTIRRLVMRPKAPLSLDETANVVCRVQCSSCEANYVGETGKRLQTRMSEQGIAVKEDGPALTGGGTLCCLWTHFHLPEPRNPRPRYRPDSQGHARSLAHRTNFHQLPHDSPGGIPGLTSAAQ